MSAAPPRRSTAVTTTAALLGLALLTVSAPVTTASAVPAPAAAAQNPSGNFLKLWTAEWMGNHGAYTSEQAVALAQRVDFIAAMKGRFSTADVAAMKTANPDLRFGVYRNATFGGKTLPDALYARNAAGEKIHAIKWPTTFLMQLGSAAWSAEINRSCADLLARSGYDSCYLDVLGSGPLTSVYLSSKPVDEHGNVWTPNQWIANTARLAASAASALGRPVTGNGIGHGGRYFSTTMSSRPLLVAAAPAQVAAEGFVRDAHASVTAYRKEAAWRQDVDMLVDAEAQGPGMMTVTKIWANATLAQQDAWHEYALATFLLGSGGKSKFFFLRDKSADSSLMNHPFNLINPGTPLGAYTTAGGLYQREFTAATVLVNPTKNPILVPLTRSYISLTGQPVSGTITLPPNTARVLRF